jgi:excisionase family DNA binding protein
MTREEFLTVAEVAERLRLNQQTVRNWLDAGKLPAVRIGRRVRILRSDYDALVGQSYRTPPEEAAGDDRARGFWDGSWQPDAQTPGT